MADYLPQNRAELHRWLDGQSEFNWNKTLKMIATSEGSDWCEIEKMEEDAKSKV